tara:strand:+ start:1801 stop:2103 length:303 start_codon:yes stop_codon:yes gene_type:complete
MTDDKYIEDQLPPIWLIEEQIAQQKEDAKYLVKYNKRQVEKQKLILASLEKFLFSDSYVGSSSENRTFTGVLNAIEETKEQIRMYRKEVLSYTNYLLRKE